MVFVSIVINDLLPAWPVSRIDILLLSLIGNGAAKHVPVESRPVKAIKNRQHSEAMKRYWNQIKEVELVKVRAVSMIKNGIRYRQISKELNVSLGTLSMWKNQWRLAEIKKGTG